MVVTMKNNKSDYLELYAINYKILPCYQNSNMNVLDYINIVSVNLILVEGIQCNSPIQYQTAIMFTLQNI